MVWEFRAALNYFVKMAVSDSLTGRNLWEYTGVIHIHSVFSDGTGKLNDLVDPANELGLDFLVLTDHMCVQARAAGWEGYHDHVLFLVGYEHNDKAHHNHYIVLGQGVEVIPADSAPVYVAEAKKRGYVGLIAHPEETRSRIPMLPPYPWDAWDIKDFDGIEIWNLMSDWVEQVTPFNFIFRLFFPRRFMCPPSLNLLKRWDRMTKERRVSIVGGADVHAFHYRLGFLGYTLIPYKVGFQSIRTHLLLDRPLTGSFQSDAASVLMALREGRAFVSNFRHGDAWGFRVWGEGPGGGFGPGEERRYQSGSVLRAQTPQPAALSLLRDGAIVFSSASGTLEFAVKEPGVYRVEAARGGKAWIYTNPIYLR
jgi:hypothetical protein